MGSEETTTEAPMFTKDEVRGAGVAGGVVGLFLGGPILAVIAGVVAAKVAKGDHKVGRFFRKHGKKVSKWVVQGCDWVKDKMHPAGSRDNEEGIAYESPQEKPVLVKEIV